MVAVRGFKPPCDRLFWVSRRRWVEAFHSALIEANEWIDRESIEVINVESLGGPDTSYSSRSIRVWYRTANSKPDPTPEV